jgi:hypothetical protein
MRSCPLAPSRCKRSGTACRARKLIQGGAPRSERSRCHQPQRFDVRQLSRGRRNPRRSRGGRYQAGADLATLAGHAGTAKDQTSDGKAASDQPLTARSPAGPSKRFRNARYILPPVVVRQILLLLRWKIKIRYFMESLADVRRHPVLLWHSAAKWQWWAVLFVGALGVIPLGEYAFGVFLLALSALSAASKLHHWRGVPNSFLSRNALKYGGMAGVVLVFVVAVLITIDIKDNSPWSHLPGAWSKMMNPHPNILRTGPSQSMPTSTTEDDTESSVLVGCEMPLQPVPWDQPLFVIQFPYPAGIEPATVISTSKEPRMWPPEELDVQILLSNRLYRCTLTNYGSEAVFAFVAEFGFTLAEAVIDPRNPRVSKSGAVIARQTNPIRVRVLDKNGGTFVFYLYNPSKYFVTVEKPRFATAELNGKKGQRQIRLKQSGPNEPKTFFLSPKD